MSSDFAPDPLSLMDKNRSRSGRKRKSCDMGNLSQCLCEDTVSLTQIEASAIKVVQCKKVQSRLRNGMGNAFKLTAEDGPHSQKQFDLQYHLACIGMEQVPRNWTCPSCISSGVGRAKYGPEVIM